MYQRSFLLVVFALILVGVMTTGAKMSWPFFYPGSNQNPSAYDPKITVEDAARSSQKPLLIEFYSDSCQTCKIVTPVVADLGKKYQGDLTFVMVNVYDPKQGQIADLFKIEYVPTIYIFDFHHMKSVQISPKTYGNRTAMEKALVNGIAEVKQHAKSATSRPPMMRAS